MFESHAQEISSATKATNLLPEPFQSFNLHVKVVNYYLFNC